MRGERSGYAREHGIEERNGLAGHDPGSERVWRYTCTGTIAHTLQPAGLLDAKEGLRTSHFHARPADKSHGTRLLDPHRHPFIGKVHRDHASNKGGQGLHRLEGSIFDPLHELA